MIFLLLIISFFSLSFLYGTSEVNQRTRPRNSRNTSLNSVPVLPLSMEHEECQLPDHLQKEDWISIRTPDGKLGYLERQLVEKSNFLSMIAWYKLQDPSIDIDLMMDNKDPHLKKILTLENIEFVLKIAQAHPASLRRQENNPLFFVYVLDILNDLNIPRNFSSNQNSAYSKAMIKYLMGKNLSWYESRKYEYGRFTVVPAAGMSICLDAAIMHKLNKQKEKGKYQDRSKYKVKIYNNDMNSIIFDTRKIPQLEKVSLVNPPQTFVPSIQLKNLSGKDQFCLKITGCTSTLTAKQQQELYKMLWPTLYPWYKPTALFASLTYHGTQMVLISNQCIRLAALYTIIRPYMHVTSNKHLEKIIDKSSLLKIIFLLPILIPASIIVGTDCIAYYLRKKFISKYYNYNELKINNRIRYPFSENFLDKIEKKLHDWCSRPL